MNQLIRIFQIRLLETVIGAKVARKKTAMQGFFKLR